MIDFEINDRNIGNYLALITEDVTDIMITTSLEIQEMLPLPNLPNLREVGFRNCPNLRNFSAQMPETVRKLYLEECPNLEFLSNIQNGLTHLIINQCGSFSNLNGLPQTLKLLQVKECPIDEVPQLPENFEDLRIINCPIFNLPVLPQELRTLYLENCYLIEELPVLPRGLDALYLDGCDNLELTEQLRAELDFFEERDFAFEGQYPEHFVFDAREGVLKQRLERVINALPYEPKPTNIKTMMHRFLTEGIDYRGGFEAVEQYISPMLDFIEAHPESLAWIEEIAKVSLDGCVNQPVAGVTEILFYIGVAVKETLEEKTEAAKRLMVLAAVKEFIVAEIAARNLAGDRLGDVVQDAQDAADDEFEQSDEEETETSDNEYSDEFEDEASEAEEERNLGELVEVEAGNVLLKRVAQRLRQERDINEEWLGVPSLIAYEDTIINWLSPDKVERAYQIAKEKINCDPEELSAFLCETHTRNVWREIVFFDEMQQVRASFAKRFEILAECSQDQEERSANYEESLTADEDKAYYDSAKNMSLEEIGAVYSRLENERDEALSSRNNILTRRILFPMEVAAAPSAGAAGQDYDRLPTSSTEEPEAKRFQNNDREFRK